ncbi:pentatricopeptide repeat-containing protein At1g64100-like [Mangifera indica]|uniref:pentatricopeptide repeat-containing protein At1g64100-like n=1 Tax=Mangifera indica TaxID=29780 RepID=UPI001CFA724E|nr:pentatricopeptide repeat-containing protein At1g64100-like [Mangifera indica]
MRASNLLPDGLIYRELIRRTSETHTLDDANYLLEEMMENGRTPAVDVLVDLVVGLSAMLEGCCNAGKVFLAKSILDKMDERKITDCDSWNILIIWLSENMAIRKADELLCRMFIFSIVPDSTTYSALVVGYCWLRKYEDALQVFHQKETFPFIKVSKGEGNSNSGTSFRDSVENVEVETTFIEDYEKSEEDVSKQEDIMSKGKSSSLSPSVISPSRNKKTSVV